MNLTRYSAYAFKVRESVFMVPPSK